MKIVAEYKEFSDIFDKSLVDNIHIKNPNKIILLAYMKNAEVKGIRCSSAIDYVKNENTGLSVKKYSDGEFVWTDEMIYHFEKYDLKLSDSFERYVLSNMIR